MPTISMFYGIIITMNWNDHNPPHIHAKYQDKNAIFTFDGELNEGKFPKKQTRLVQAWIALHEEELVANWNLAMSGEILFRIDPL